MKLKTTKNNTRAQKAKSPNAFSGDIDLNSLDDVNCSRNDAIEQTNKQTEDETKKEQNERERHGRLIKGSFVSVLATYLPTRIILHDKKSWKEMH